MTLATMDEGEASKVTVTDSIPASSKRGVNCRYDSNSCLLAIQFIMTSSDVLMCDFDDIEIKYQMFINFYYPNTEVLMIIALG